MSKCSHCNKKLGLIKFTCKCEKIFCINHLHYEAHECSFDVKSHQRKQLNSQMNIGQLSSKLREKI
jgi:hypothetical protein